MPDQKPCPTHGVVHGPEGHGPAPVGTRVLSSTGSGRVESQQIVQGKDVTYTLAAGADQNIKDIALIKQRVQAMSEGKEDPGILRRDLELYYQRQMTQRSYGGKLPEVKGAKWITLIYWISQAQQYSMTWQWLPNSAGGPAMVTGLCPECMRRAPSQVDVTQRTKPVIVEGRLGWMPGNREADAKEVTFRLCSPIFHMRLDEKDRLTVREIVRCTSGRHGPTAQLAGDRCDWAVRIEDGIATKVSSRIVRPGAKEGGGTRGQIVLPGAAEAVAPLPGGIIT